MSARTLLLLVLSPLLAAACTDPVVSTTAPAPAPAPAPAGVSAVEVQAHKDRMIEAQDIKFGIIETLAAGSTADVPGQIDALLPLLLQEIGYWDRTGLEDIGALARDNLEQVRAVRVPAAAGQADAAFDAWSRVEQGCSGCHDLHPERRVTVLASAPAPGK